MKNPLINPQRLLLLPISGLGDAVFYLPFIKILRARFPKAEIIAIVASSAARIILESCSANIEIIVFNRSEQRGWRQLLGLLRALRRRRFDLVISGAHANSVRVTLLAFLCGAKVTVGASFERLSLLYTHRADIPTDAHYFERYRLLLAEIGIVVSPEEYQPTLQPPLEARDSAIRIWKGAGLGEAEIVVGMASGADLNSRGRWKPYLKRWNTKGYAEVAKWVTKELGARVVMIGVPGEAPLAQEIAAISGVPIVNLCGQTGLGELQWLISKCTIFIANDTGTLHMAGALGVQVVGLFGPTSPDYCHPPGDKQWIVQGHALCSPCFPHPTCNLEKCRAMDDISASLVMNGISALLSSHTTESAIGQTAIERFRNGVKAGSLVHIKNAVIPSGETAAR